MKSIKPTYNTNRVAPVLCDLVGNINDVNARENVPRFSVRGHHPAKTAGAYSSCFVFLAGEGRNDELSNISRR